VNGCTHLERVIGAIARLLANAGIVAIGSSSPVEAAGALLAQAVYPCGTRALVFRNNLHDPFPESGSELYDRIGQGRIDVFFLSGGQIDGRANLNMVGVGPYPRMPVRFSGNHGTPFIYLMVPRIILYREEHSRRTLVPKVDQSSIRWASIAIASRASWPNPAASDRGRRCRNGRRPRTKAVLRREIRWQAEATAERASAGADYGQRSPLRSSGSSRYPMPRKTRMPTPAAAFASLRRNRLTSTSTFDMPVS